MNDPQTKVDDVDAREVSKARVTTLENLLPKTAEEPASEVVAEATGDKVDDKPKVKKSPQERIQELANFRREAEREAADARRENEELRARIKALEIVVPAITVEVKPERHDYASETDFIEAYTDWKTKKVLADREREQQQAKLQATSEEIKRSYDKTAEVARLKFDDFDTVIGNARTAVPEVISMAIMDSPVGGELTYYLAKNENELRKLVDVVMVDKRPIQALRKLAQLERELMADDEESDTTEKEGKPQVKKKAPEPINPVSGTNALQATTAKSFEEYRALRKAARK